MQLKNLTIEVPLSATQHNNSRTFCTRGPPWKDGLSVVTFFATSYVAHAATVKSTPGEGTISMAFNTFMALCFPMFGLLRALNAIARIARFGGSELRNACRAGALCMVVRSPEWRPEPGETLEATLVERSQQDVETGIIEDDVGGNVVDAKLVSYFPTYAREDSSAWAYFDTIGSRAYVDPDLTRIHGTYSISKGYTFAIVPRNACLLELNRINTAPPCSHGDEAAPTTVTTSQTPNAEAIVNRDSNSARDVDLHDRMNPQPPAPPGTTSNESVDRTGSPRPDSRQSSASVKTSDKRSNATSDISSNYSIAKAIASLIQVLGALSILVLKESGTIDRWGYASFHLTVLPYMVMTVVNFVSNLCTADYACLYMVESALMREARSKGSVFDGTVAALEEYQRPLSPDVTANDIESWTGVTQKHIRSIASILSGAGIFELLIGGDWVDHIFDSNRRQKPRISSVKFTCDEVAATTHRRSENTAEGDQQNHESVQPVLRRSSDIEMEPVPTARPLARENEGSSLPTADDRHGSDDPTLHQNESQLTAEHSHHTDSAGACLASVITLRDSNGQKYIIHQYRPTRWLDLPQLLGRNSNKEELPQSAVGASNASKSTKKLKGFRIAYFNHLYGEFFFRALEPIQLRLLATITHVKQNATGKESWVTLLGMLYRGLSDNTIQARTGDTIRRKIPKPVIYVPNCPPFLRKGEKIDQPPRGRGNAGVMMVLEILLGCLILGLIVIVLGWLSHWFSRGASSRIERAIIMLWMAEGAFGLLLPLLSLKELVMVFLLLPLYTTILRRPGLGVMLSTPALHYSFLIAFVPVGIFMAPIWGFVIVGKQLVEWGNCVSLY